MIGYTEFGLEVRQKLLVRRKSMRFLAKTIGCSEGHLSELLKGSRELITKDNNWKEKIEEVLVDD